MRVKCQIDMTYISKSVLYKSETSQSVSQYNKPSQRQVSQSVSQCNEPSQSQSSDKYNKYKPSTRQSQYNESSHKYDKYKCIS